MRQRFNTLTRAAGIGVASALALGALSGCSSATPEQRNAAVAKYVRDLDPASRVGFDYAGDEAGIDLSSGFLALDREMISRQDCLETTPYNTTPYVDGPQPPVITLVGKDTIVVTPVGATPDQALKFTGYAGDPLKILKPASQHTLEVFAGSKCDPNDSTFN